MPDHYDGAERRKFKRLKANFIVIYRVDKPLEVVMVVGTREITALMLDMSEGGMAILTGYNIPMQTIIYLKFTLINPYVFTDDRIRTMEITGEVRYNARLENNEYRLGIYFMRISDEDKAAIVSFVKLAFNH